MGIIDRRTLLGSGLAAAGIAALPWRARAHVIVPPYKLYDTHGHFYTNDVDKYPFNSRTARYGSEIMVAKEMRYPQTPKEAFAFWEERGMEKGAGVQYSSTYRFDNSYLLDISAEHPDRIIPVVILDPVGDDTPAHLEKMVRESRIAGVRFTGTPVRPDGASAGPGSTNSDFVFLSEAAAPFWEAANRLGLLIVLMPIGGDTPGAMARLAEHAAPYPDVNILLDHIGFPRPELGPNFGLSPQHRALTQHKNVSFKYTTLLIEMLHAAHVTLPTVPRAHGGDLRCRPDDLGKRCREHARQHVHMGPACAGFIVGAERAAAARPVLQHGRAHPCPRRPRASPGLMTDDLANRCRS